MKRSDLVISVMAAVCVCILSSYSVVSSSGQTTRLSAPARERVPVNTESSETTSTVRPAQKVQKQVPVVRATSSEGFCCIDAMVSTMSKAECNRKRGVFYTDETKAQQGCTGYCCRDGDVQETTKAICSRKLRGTFYTDRILAENNCKGWCCKDFEVTEKTGRQCAAAKGEFFGTKAEADRFCSMQKGVVLS